MKILKTKSVSNHAWNEKNVLKQGKGEVKTGLKYCCMYCSENRQKNQGKYDYDLIPVHSAFNGFAIYKTSMFLNCSYSSMIHINLFPKHLIRCKIVNDFKNDCEHRKFHLEAIKKNGARIMVSPLSIFYKLPVPNPKLRGPA